MSLSRGKDPYAEFRAIIAANYSPERICLMNAAVDEKMSELDYEVAKSICNDNHSVKSLFDWEVENLDFNFPDPPEISW